MTEKEIEKAIAPPNGDGTQPLGCSNGGGPSWLEMLAAEKRAGQLTHTRGWWVAAERLPSVQAVYPDAGVEPLLVPPESDRKKVWERSDALRELVRGRMELIGPITAPSLAEFLELPQTEL